MKHLDRLAKSPVGKLTQPKGGVFAGRQIPKNRLNDENWLKVLEMPKPPQDGPYVPREQVIETNAPKPVKSRGFLYKIAKAMVDYDMRDVKRKAPPGQRPSSRPKVVREPKTDRQVLHVPNVTDWNELSPDTEAEYLGLEQLLPNEKLTIVGAGITGLVLAWVVNRSRPDIRINIYDSHSEVGGWMSSSQLDVGDGHKVLCESGPRTLLPSHPGSEIIARILAEIGVRDELMAGVPRSSPTNQKAVVLNGQIEKLPNSLGQTAKFLASSPLLKGARWQIFKDLWNRARSPMVNDESVHSFVSRRIGPAMADRMISALMRGIYAADARELSARSVARLSRLYYLERTESMSILGAALSGSLGFLDAYAKEALPLVFDSLAPPASRSVRPVDRHLVNKQNPIPKFSLYGFPHGIQGVAKALAEDLSKRKNVELYLGQKVSDVVPNSARTVKFTVGEATTEEATTEEANVLVSTVARPELFSASQTAAETMSSQRYSSLAVVNVWVPNPEAAKDWFGILVPKTEDGNNTNGVLGIIFDSSIRNASHDGPKEPGSAMTVMIGGDLWTDMDEGDAKARALAGLEQLGIPTDGAVSHVRLQRDAIPLYGVGHSQRQHAVHRELQAAYRNRVALVGMAYGRGCGVSDCIVDAVTLALRFSEQRKLLHPEFFFNHWWTMTRPEYYA